MTPAQSTPEGMVAYIKKMEWQVREAGNMALAMEEKLEKRDVEIARLKATVKARFGRLYKQIYALEKERKGK